MDKLLKESDELKKQADAGRPLKNVVLRRLKEFFELVCRCLKEAQRDYIRMLK